MTKQVAQFLDCHLLSLSYSPDQKEAYMAPYPPLVCKHKELEDLKSELEGQTLLFEAFDRFLEGWLVKS